MKIVQPNGKDSIVYQFYDMVVNKPPTPGRSIPPAGAQRLAEGDCGGCRVADEVAFHCRRCECRNPRQRRR